MREKDASLTGWHAFLTSRFIEVLLITPFVWMSSPPLLTDGAGCLSHSRCLAEMSLGSTSLCDNPPAPRSPSPGSVALLGYLKTTLSFLGNFLCCMINFQDKKVEYLLLRAAPRQTREELRLKSSFRARVRTQSVP